MNILFINANLYGHINPTLGFVQNLCRKGHQVDYFCSEAFQEIVKKTGANWIGYDDNTIAFLQKYKPSDCHPFFMLMEYMISYDEAVLPKLLHLLQSKPYDMVICDSFFGAGCYLRRLITVPIICSHSSFAMSKTPVPERMLVPQFHPQLDRCYEINRRICEKCRIEEPTLEEIFTSKGERNIVYTTPSFNGDSSVCEPEYLFIGPSIDRISDMSEVDFSGIGEKKVIYISLGSVNTDFLEFYQMCLKAFSKSDYIVCMSIGRKSDITKLGTIPENFIVKEFLPQLQILKRANVFITHAGFNSVNEALYFGVPMLTLPLVNDQHMVAKRVVAMKLGITENMHELTEKILLEKVGELIHNESIKENCRKISVEMMGRAKTEETIKLLEEWKEKRIVH